MAQQSDVPSSIGLLILRLGFGAYMATHGYTKLEKVLARDFRPDFDPIGLGPELSLVAAMLAEFGCGLLVAVGCLTRFAAVPVVFTMGVAAFVAHANDPWTLGTGGSKQPAMMFLIAFLALVFTGGGKFSFDEWWKGRGKGRRS